MVPGISHAARGDAQAADRDGVPRRRLRGKQPLIQLPLASDSGGGKGGGQAAVDAQPRAGVDAGQAAEVLHVMDSVADYVVGAPGPQSPQWAVSPFIAHSVDAAMRRYGLNGTAAGEWTTLLG